MRIGGGWPGPLALTLGILSSAGKRMALGCGLWAVAIAGLARLPLIRRCLRRMRLLLLILPWCWPFLLRIVCRSCSMTLWLMCLAAFIPGGGGPLRE